MWRHIQGDAREGPLACASLCDARRARGLRALRALLGPRPLVYAFSLFCPLPPSAASSRCACARRSPRQRQGAAQDALRAWDGPRGKRRPRDTGRAGSPRRGRSQTRRAPSCVSRASLCFVCAYRCRGILGGKLPGWVIGQFLAKLPGNWVILGSLRNKKARPFGAAALQGRVSNSYSIYQMEQSFETGVAIRVILSI